MGRAKQQKALKNLQRNMESIEESKQRVEQHRLKACTRKDTSSSHKRGTKKEVTDKLVALLMREIKRQKRFGMLD